MRRWIVAATASGTLAITGSAFAQTEVFRSPGVSASARVTDLVSHMTTDEKIDALSTDSGVPRLGVPSFGSSEGIHGVVQRGDEKRHRSLIPTTQFPQPPGMGETWDPDLVRQVVRGRRRVRDVLRVHGGQQAHDDDEQE